MRMVELFSGSGVMSERFALGGWETETVDLLRGRDVMSWEPKGEYKFVWAAPPCEQYSALRYSYDHIWKADRTLWLRTLELVYRIGPRFWVIENVKMAQWVWGRAPYHYGSFFMWGYYPPMPKIPWTRSMKGTHCDRSKGNLRTNEDRTAAERATYPSDMVEAVFSRIDRAIKVFLP